MPGDPLRAKYIAETFLTKVVQVNTVRNMFGYTGYFGKKKVTVMGSGMGMPSIGIYSYELFAFYGVEKIIRIGSCGAYSPDLKLYDVILAKDAYSESSYAKTMGISSRKILAGSTVLNNRILKASEETGIPVHVSRIHSSDVFYRIKSDEYKEIHAKFGADAVEMESFALFANAKALKKKAACLLTVSDSLVTHEATSAKERQEAFTKMMELALHSL
ncbi:MAG: purine-nucleoside phosphorylase [Tenericutes bacterium GWC2_34_14]|nr:MAG: purine-nucleoside phosphorylase [Tenericutes bacterium GWA2_35_7]OHE29660.1 MAG: purine-nucleoside phosphorylase [Tenericutes bacterium GWC2_34_14]OHE34241.1 MAG: purine-nucleoside phosphorylase [Tenericutes bacterium GWE2_34_108]OHE35571.1 MAG: purine-nucleoside phosphorylase [Tenericutes bacterium GWF1_35_14]OHE38618.1 MAG: purine-nucleoside phosphorylase [Tenericutes bacterium GWF2_35_184]OHE41616.1 MAG: purine-nucleoside phosphorylase [Tenericutes bacterium RIFOXYA12_FULL_35_10]OH